MTTQMSGRERALAVTGVTLWALGCLAGAFILAFFFLLFPMLSEKGPLLLRAQGIAIAFALPAAIAYMLVPLLIDRFEPEPWWALFMAFLWGALAAAGFAVIINTAMGIAGGLAMGAVGEAVAGAVISAPLVEEFFKGLVPLGVFLFMRRHFDGVVDGIVYSIYAGLGFAMTENVLYYSQGLLEGQDAFTFQIVLRGILKPWGHPLYTAMIGIGIGLARESTSGVVKVLAPIGGFVLGAGLHMAWNFTAVLSGLTGVPFILLLLLFYFGILTFFGGIVVYLMIRESRVLKENLRDEVIVGLISEEQLRFAISPVATIRARFRGGSWPKFVRALIRLGMVKWHAARAMKGQKKTLSYDQIAPLRQEVARLRTQLG